MHMASVHTRQVLNFTYVKLHRTKVEPSVAGFTSIIEVVATYIGGCPLTSSYPNVHT